MYIIWCWSNGGDWSCSAVGKVTVGLTESGVVDVCIIVSRLVNWTEY